MRLMFGGLSTSCDRRVGWLLAGGLILAACGDRSLVAPFDLSAGANDTRAYAAKGGGKGGGKPGGEQPPANPAIAFVQNTALTVMNADGSNQTVVLDAGESFPRYEPKWSPDGTQLVFESSIEGPGVYVIDVDGTNLRKVVATTAGRRPVWSPVLAPDGRFKIAYVDLPRPPDGTVEGDNYDLFLVNIDGTGRINLTNTGELHESSPTWSPGAERLAADVQKYTSAEPGGLPVGLFLYDLGLTAQGEITISSQTDITGAGPLSTAYRVFRPAWSKTQDKIAVVVFETGESFRDIWAIDIGSPGNPTNVTQSPDVSENMPSWSPDDSQIVFQRTNSKKRASIFVMNADGSGATEIGKPKKGLAGQRSPDWRRNP